MSAGDLPLAAFLVTRTHPFLAAVAVNAERSLLLFRWVTSGYLHRLRTRDDVSLPPDVSAPPTFFLGDFARTLLCCGHLLRIWLILAYLILALRCLPVIFTGICFLCPQCHLEFEFRSWAAIHYNPLPPPERVGRMS
jgi:hypothetical protein